MNKVEHFHSGSWVDISDYIIGGVDKIPRSLSNRDFTLRADMFTLQVAITIQDYYSNPAFKFLAGDKLKFTLGTDFIYEGSVAVSDYDYSGVVFNVKIKPFIMTLEDVIIDYNTLHAQFATGTNWYDYVAADYYGNPIVGILWAMKCVFALAGYTLDSSAIDAIQLFSKAELAIPGTPWGVTVTYQDLILEEDRIWCIGQTVSTNHSQIDALYGDKKINGFTFISECLSSLNLVLQQTGDTSFALVGASSITGANNYVVADDDNYDYQYKNVEKKKTIDSISVRVMSSAGLTVAANLLDKCQSSAVTNIETWTLGKGSGIDYLSNFVILATDAKKFTDKYLFHYSTTFLTPVPSLTLAANDEGIDTYGVNMNTGYRKILSAVSNLAEETILTNYQPTSKAVTEHNIDLVWDNSEIVQEVYE